MAGDSPTPRQEDIEDLLRQAQMAAGLAPETAPAAPVAAAAQSAAPVDSLAAAPQAARIPASTAVATAPAESASSPSRPAFDSGVGDDIQYLLAQAEQAIASVDQPLDSLERLQPFEFKDLTKSPPSGEKATLELLKDVDLNLRIELGRTQMYLEDVLKLKRGSVVTLDKLAGDPVDVFVNGRIVARGEVLVLNENFCVRVTELLAGDDFD
jgi:flagellar motor switch protein FliN/FliY